MVKDALEQSQQSQVPSYCLHKLRNFIPTNFVLRWKVVPIFWHGRSIFKPQLSLSGVVNLASNAIFLQLNNFLILNLIG